MKISIFLDQAESPIILEDVDPNDTLFDLIRYLNDRNAAHGLPPVNNGVFHGAKLITDLNRTLFHLFKTTGSITLHASTIRADQDQGLVQEVLEQHTQALLEAKVMPVQDRACITPPTPVREFSIQPILADCLPTFPTALIQLLAEYCYEKCQFVSSEFVGSKYDSYLIFDAIRAVCDTYIRPYFAASTFAVHRNKFYILLIHFLMDVFDINDKKGDGHISVSTSDKMEEIKGRHSIDGPRMRAIASFESAQEFCRHPAFMGPSQELVCGYSLIIHLFDHVRVRGIYVRPYAEHGFESDLTYIDFSNLYLPKDQVGCSDDRLKVSLAHYALKTMFKTPPRVVAYPKQEIPIEFSPQSPVYGLARDYFLACYPKKDNRWNQSHTLDEILSYAIQTGKAGFADKATKKTILTMLRKNDRWFDQQTHQSLRNEVLNQVQLCHQASRYHVASLRTNGPLSACSATQRGTHAGEEKEGRGPSPCKQGMLQAMQASVNKLPRESEKRTTLERCLGHYQTSPVDQEQDYLLLFIQAAGKPRSKVAPFNFRLFVDQIAEQGMTTSLKVFLTQVEQGGIPLMQAIANATGVSWDAGVSALEYQEKIKDLKCVLVAPSAFTSGRS